PSILSSMILCFPVAQPSPILHPFPTRRSSDLLCTAAIAQDGLVHLFGCGHSRMLCEEMTPRQGCFVGWHTLVELGLTYHNVIVGDRKSTRLNSSHLGISYAVFCLKKKNIIRCI